MNWALYIIAATCTFGAIVTIARVGEPRKPITAVDAAIITVINAAVITILVLAAVQLT